MDCQAGTKIKKPLVFSAIECKLSLPWLNNETSFEPALRLKTRAPEAEMIAVDRCPMALGRAGLVLFSWRLADELNNQPII